MIDIIVASFLIGLSGAASPGPMTASVLGLGSRRPAPFVAGLVAGHGIPEAVMVAAIACGVRDVPYIDFIALLGSGVLMLALMRESICMLIAMVLFFLKSL
ncbi:MAG: hypothetical protein PHR49_09780 [Methanoculleus sp.]|nr:hypothetical protein [Methanoculleus sp.]